MEGRVRKQGRQRGIEADGERGNSIVQHIVSQVGTSPQYMGAIKRFIKWLESEETKSWLQQEIKIMPSDVLFGVEVVNPFWRVKVPVAHVILKK